MFVMFVVLRLFGPDGLEIVVRCAEVVSLDDATERGFQSLAARRELLTHRQQGREALSFMGRKSNGDTVLEQHPTHFAFRPVQDAADSSLSLHR